MCYEECADSSYVVWVMECTSRGVVKWWYDNEMRKMKMCFWLLAFGTFKNLSTIKALNKRYPGGNSKYVIRALTMSVCLSAVYRGTVPTTCTPSFQLQTEHITSSFFFVFGFRDENRI